MALFAVVQSTPTQKIAFIGEGARYTEAILHGYIPSQARPLREAAALFPAAAIFVDARGGFGRVRFLDKGCGIQTARFRS